MSRSVPTDELTKSYIEQQQNIIQPTTTEDDNYNNTLRLSYHQLLRRGENIGLHQLTDSCN